MFESVQDVDVCVRAIFIRDALLVLNVTSWAALSFVVGLPMAPAEQACCSRIFYFAHLMTVLCVPVGV